MGEYEATSSSSTSEGEESLIAAAKNIVKALDTYKNFTNDARKILVDLGFQLINMARTSENTEDKSASEIEIKQLNTAQDKDVKWEVNQSKIENYGPRDTNKYLKVADDVPKLTERLEELDVSKDGGEDSDAMKKLKLEEFRNLLVWNRQPFKPKDTSSKDDSVNDGGTSFYGNREEDELLQKASDILPTAVHKTHHTIDNASIVSSADSEEEELLKRASDILQMAVQRARNTMDDDSIVSSGDSDDWCSQIYDLFQTAEGLEEFGHFVAQSGQIFESENVAIHSNEDSKTVDLVDELVKRDNIIRDSNSEIFKPVNPEAIPDLKSIANFMFDLNHGPECSQAYISVRSDALNDCLLVLEVEKLSIDDLLKMEWKTLWSKYKKFIRAMEIFVLVLLPGEKWLSDQIFVGLGSISSMCFAESSRASILQLLNFAKAVSTGPHFSEKLFPVLDMYEELSELVSHIDALHKGNTASHVRMEWQETLIRLGKSAKKTFMEFEYAVETYSSSHPFPSGAIHPLTKSVMNYINVLSGYKETLDVILEGHEKEVPVSASSDCSSDRNYDNFENSLGSPVTSHFKSVLSILEGILDGTSKLYKDDAQQHLFLMNNYFYMTQKVKNSSTSFREILLDEWIVKHEAKFRQHGVSYERATWSSILALLKDDGLQKPGKTLISKTLLRQRLQRFYSALEEVYKRQTGWLVPDDHLREELQISASLKVVPALRSFVRRYYHHIGNKHIKYTPEHLESFLHDLFEGSSRSLHNSNKKG